MNTELEQIKKFIDAFEEVFHKDWNYTKEMILISDYISPNGSFIEPKIEDEIEDWGYRGNLLIEYRKLKAILSNCK